MQGEKDAARMDRLVKIWLRLPYSEGIPSADYDWFISHARLLTREQILQIRESDTMDHFKQQVEQEILIRGALKFDSWTRVPLLWIGLATLVFSFISALPVIKGALSGKKTSSVHVQSPSQNADTPAPATAVAPVPAPPPAPSEPEWHPIIRGGGGPKP